MSPLAIGMDIFLAVLMISALIMGVRLNGRLKALRQSYQGFAKAIVELNEAATRAEKGLAALREATSETHDSLLSRIETARSLAGKLDGQIKAARALSESPELSRAIQMREADAARGQAPAALQSALPSGVLKLAERFGVIGEAARPGRAPVSSERDRALRPDRPAARAPLASASSARVQTTRRRNDFEDDLFAPGPSARPDPQREPLREPVGAAAPRQRLRPESREEAFPPIRRDRRPDPEPVYPDAEDEAPMTLTTVAEEPLALDDFAARIRARRAAG